MGAVLLLLRMALQATDAVAAKENCTRQRCLAYIVTKQVQDSSPDRPAGSFEIGELAHIWFLF